MEILDFFVIQPVTLHSISAKSFIKTGQTISVYELYLQKIGREFLKRIETKTQYVLRFFNLIVMIPISGCVVSTGKVHDYEQQSHLELPDTREMGFRRHKIY